MSNAIQYTPQGGKVEIRARRRPAATVIAVRDTGAGIASVHLERIFHRLYRADDARDRATGGSGLGLAIARGAARLLGGRIEVDSQPGSRSEFRLILPVGPPALADEEAAARLPSAAGKPGRPPAQPADLRLLPSSP